LGHVTGWFDEQAEFSLYMRGWGCRVCIALVVTCPACM
jgi:hypothetical protein